MPKACAACQSFVPCTLDCEQLFLNAQLDLALVWQVNCRDRRGLLSDVITAIKSFPLEITTAAVTTTADGYVYDVFQVHSVLLCAMWDWTCHVRGCMDKCPDNVTCTTSMSTLTPCVGSHVPMKLVRVTVQ